MVIIINNNWILCNIEDEAQIKSNRKKETFSNSATQTELVVFLSAIYYLSTLQITRDPICTTRATSVVYSCLMSACSFTLFFFFHFTTSKEYNGDNAKKRQTKQNIKQTRYKTVCSVEKWHLSIDTHIGDLHWVHRTHRECTCNCIHHVHSGNIYVLLWLTGECNWRRLFGK